MLKTYYQVDLGNICLLGFSPEELVIRLATMKNNLVTLNFITSYEHL